VLYGRADQIFSRFTAKIEGNSFAYNYVVDNISDTIVHAANFGIYGTDQTFPLKKNFLGSNSAEKIKKTIYDQTLNYNAPKIEFEPFLSQPNGVNPTHIFNITNLDDSELVDTLKMKEPLKGFTVTANNGLDFSKATLLYSYFNDDSTLKRTDTLLTFDKQPNGNDYKLTVTKTANAAKKTGYFLVSNIQDTRGNFVPDVKVGYINYQNDFRRRRLLADLVKEKKADDSLRKPPSPVDSIKNVFQKIEAPMKSKFEVGLATGGAIFLGTISSSNLFQNQMNLYNGLNVNYTIYSNLSAALTVAMFKLSNEDKNSSNNEQVNRGMSFSTSMLSISPSINYDFIDNRLYTKARRFRPSIGLGFDIFSFNPTAKQGSKEFALQPLGTGGQLIDSGKKVYSLLSFGYFLNVKLKYQLNRFNSVGVHFSYHKSLSDYLDDVGPDAYPNKAKLLLKDPTGAAAYFSDPRQNPSNEGKLRASPNSPSDSYINFGIFYSRRLFK
jgi:hypothetical protein